MDKVRGFTEKQRQWFLRRDGHRCMFWTMIDGKWVRCKNAKRLQVHHILPRGFCSMHFPKDFAVNGATNGITLCEMHHIGNAENDLYVVHPDTRTAHGKYADDRNSYRQMMEAREVRNRLGVPYWNTVFDWMFNRLAVKQTEMYRKSNPDDKYPG